MTLAELNVARISPSVIVIQDYLYVFGGKTDVGFTTQIERLNLK
jgi:Kelch motif